jgi:hypothetical protein
VYVCMCVRSHVSALFYQATHLFMKRPCISKGPHCSALHEVPMVCQTGGDERSALCARVCVCVCVCVHALPRNEVYSALRRLTYL